MWHWLKRAAAEWTGAPDARPATAPDDLAPSEDAPRLGHRELEIALHGPGLCGKTTNLQWLFHRTAPEARGRVWSFATEYDRELSLRLYPRTFRHPSGDPRPPPR